MTLPEVLFDLDFPGHFMRRIKSVSLTIPCVTGPYVGVNCTLTLLKHSVRHSNIIPGKYVRDVENEDPRFTDSSGALQSIVTSGLNDSGLFETNLRDERYLPFEGAGALSEWRIELPKDFKPFDYETISDIILHLRYTAREAGDSLKQKASLELQAAVNELGGAQAGVPGPARLFSLRHEFSTEWHRFLNSPPESGEDQKLTLVLTKERLPFLFQNKKISFKAIEVFVKLKLGYTGPPTYDETTLKMSIEPAANVSTSPLVLARWNGLLQGTKTPAGDPGKWVLTAWLQEEGDDEHKRIDPTALQDILIVCHYTCS